MKGSQKVPSQSQLCVHQHRRSGPTGMSSPGPGGEDFGSENLLYFVFIFIFISAKRSKVGWGGGVGVGANAETLEEPEVHMQKWPRQDEHSDELALSPFVAKHVPCARAWSPSLMDYVGAPWRPQWYLQRCWWTGQWKLS